MLVPLAIAIAGLVAFALSRLELSKAGHALVNAQLQWVALALLLMGSSLVMRAISWHEVLRAALPDTDDPLAARRARDDDRRDGLGCLPGAARRAHPRARPHAPARGPQRADLLPIVAGTVFSQTLINLLALAILAVVTFTGVAVPARPRRRAS